MSTTTGQTLVAARRASPFPTRQLHSLPGLSSRYVPPSRRHISSHKVSSPQESSSSSPDLWTQVREAQPAVRYTVYAGLGLMATGETTFWLNVVRAKYFPSKTAEEQEEAAQFPVDLRVVIKGYRAVWMQNYDRYYGAYIWGAGYGGLDDLQS